MPPSVDDVMAAIDSAARHVPDLRIVVSPDCSGNAWLVDPTTSTIYVEGTAHPHDWCSALLEALDALARHHAFAPPQGLRLVTQQRHTCDDRESLSQTGTYGGTSAGCSTPRAPCPGGTGRRRDDPGGRGGPRST